MCLFGLHNRLQDLSRSLHNRSLNLWQKTQDLDISDTAGGTLVRSIPPYWIQGVYSPCRVVVLASRLVFASNPSKRVF